MRSFHIDRFRSAERGFALVVTLSLMMAIGELQREMGPDSRVSAPPDAGKETSVGQSRWTAVYDAWKCNQAPDGLETPQSRKPAFRGWLVSGANQATGGPAGTADKVLLLGAKSLGGEATADDEAMNYQFRTLAAGAGGRNVHHGGGRQPNLGGGFSVIKRRSLSISEIDQLASAIGSQVTVRRDTFIIRAYVDARDSSGRIMAKAWCEATVQRNAEYLNPADAPEAQDGGGPQGCRRQACPLLRPLCVEQPGCPRHPLSPPRPHHGSPGF